MTPRKQKIINFITWCSMGALLIFTIYGIRTGIFTDRSQMEALVSKSGIYGPLLFVLIQIIQVVIPIIPGGITCAALQLHWNCHRLMHQLLSGEALREMPCAVSGKGRNL